MRIKTNSRRYSHEELNALAAEAEAAKFEALTEDELEQAAGGYYEGCESCPYYGHSRQCFDAKGLGLCPLGHRN